MGKAIGIDLGTTNSVACFFDGVSERILLNSDNRELTPSVVAWQHYDEDTNIAVGNAAVAQAKLFPEDTIFSIKRLMGQPFAHENVQRAKARVNYKIVESQAPEPGFAAVMMGGKEYLPEDISAFVLKDIKAYSGVALGEKEITHAVITVPAHFEEPQFRATRAAGRKAGLVVKTLLPEPTAAAIAFGIRKKIVGDTILVFDLGGGTFDISLLTLFGENYNVLKTNGDRFLGGDDFDSEIVRMLIESVKQQYDGLDLGADSRFRIVAKQCAEDAKRTLSNPEKEFVWIRVPEVARAGDKVINLNFKLTRATFEDAIAPYVSRCRALVVETMSGEGFTPEAIGSVLLVGGSTAVPLVYRTLEQVFGADKLRRDVNPMLSVAIGAAVLAARMKGIECPTCLKLCDEAASQCPGCGESLTVARSVLEGMTIFEKTATNYGIEVASGAAGSRFKVMVEAGTEVPMKDPSVQVLYTTSALQSVIRVPVYQGLGSSVAQNTPVGLVEFNLPAGLPENHPVRVEFRIDRQSLVAVMVEVNGMRLEKDLTRLVNQTPADKRDAAEEDSDVYESEQARIIAMLQDFVTYSNRFLVEFEKLLFPEEKKSLNEMIEAAAKTIKEKDAEAAKPQIRNLNLRLVTCGTPSLIARAREAAGKAVDTETRIMLQDSAHRLKALAESGAIDSVQELSLKIKPVIQRIFEREADINKIVAARKFDHLLREREEISR